jgi:hypothetical protein
MSMELLIVLLIAVAGLPILAGTLAVGGALIGTILRMGWHFFRAYLYRDKHQRERYLDQHVEG